MPGGGALLPAERPRPAGERGGHAGVVSGLLRQRRCCRAGHLRLAGPAAEPGAAAARELLEGDRSLSAPVRPGVGGPGPPVEAGGGGRPLGPAGLSGGRHGVAGANFGGSPKKLPAQTGETSLKPAGEGLPILTAF